MADFNVKTDRIIEASKDIINYSMRITEFKTGLENIKFGGIFEGSYRASVERTIRTILDNISEEAVKMNSFGNALDMIANEYRTTEKMLASMQVDGGACEAVEESGTDKRSLWDKFWDWINKKEPDEYDTTSNEQEKAADAAMKKKLWKVLQDEKYSEENWDNASIEERKKILQDYMDEVIKIYGLKDVKNEIKWDAKATYSTASITWGYYTHWRHRVTLNEQALTDSIEGWDSYELLETVSHELRHAYQHEAVDHPSKYMVSKETIEIWKKNFRNYIGSDQGFDKYRAQPVEVDARDFQINRNDTI